VDSVRLWPASPLEQLGRFFSILNCIFSPNAVRQLQFSAKLIHNGACYIYTTISVLYLLQGVSGGIVNILGGGSVDYSE